MLRLIKAFIIFISFVLKKTFYIKTILVDFDLIFSYQISFLLILYDRSFAILFPIHMKIYNISLRAFLSVFLLSETLFNNLCSCYLYLCF
jgi:hypothetical protein